MRNATQIDIDRFYADTENNPDIYPYRGISKWMPKWEAQNDNNKSIILTDDRNSYLLNITFSWHRQLEFEVALFSKSAIAGGKGLHALFEQIKRYRPVAINTSVQASNKKSLKMNERLWGKAWGCEPLVAWNPLAGVYEDLYYFRKILHTP